MEFIRVFDTDSAYLSYRNGAGYRTPNVSLSRRSKTVFYNLDANDKPYVDLGLPSGTLWATMNVGAKKESDAGLYFQWGDTSGYTASQVKPDTGITTAKISTYSASNSIPTGKTIDTGATIDTGITIFDDTTKAFTWKDYKWSIDDSDAYFSKYTTTGATLELDDDAAHVNMGGDWHMPSNTQIQELINNTTSAWTTLDEVSGMTFTSTKDKSKSIFIPAAGYAYDGSVSESGSGYVWASMLGAGYAKHGGILSFSSEEAYLGSSYRCDGLSVRGVLG